MSELCITDRTSVEVLGKVELPECSLGNVVRTLYVRHMYYTYCCGTRSWIDNTWLFFHRQPLHE